MAVSKTNKKSAPLSVWGDRLKAMQDGAKAAMENYSPSAYTQVPDDIYIAKLTLELGETKQTSKMRINRRFSIIEGDQTNLSLFDGLVIEDNEVGLHIARRMFESFGYDWPEEDLSQLEAIITEINSTAPVVKIRSKTNESKDGQRTFTNVNINEVLTDYAGESAPEVDSGATPVEDDTPIEEYNSGEATPVDDAAVEETRQGLLVLAASHGIDGVTEDMSSDEIAGVFSGYQFTREELTEDEATLLESIGLADNIVEPIPKAKAKVFSAKPAPVPAKPVPAPVKRAMPAATKYPLKRK